MSLVLEEPPLAGFRAADAELGAGPLDLEAAARAEGDVAAERAVLETRGFRRGWSRAWRDAEGDVVYVAVYEFPDDAAAAAYLRDGTETLIARGAAGFPAPELPGAIGFTGVDETADGAFTTHAVAFADGPHWVLAVVGSRTSRRSPEDARSVARAQAARLAG